MSVLAKRFIARKGAFQQAITDHTILPIIAVYDDGSAVITNLTGHIESVRWTGDNVYMITTSQGKIEREVILI